MAKIQFPIFKTKIKGLNRKFDLNNPKERAEYFNLKAGKEIEKLREYFKKGNTFIAYLMGKKNSGKGTYSKMFSEIVDPERIAHLSVGDMIRDIDKELADKKSKKSLIEFLEKNYRGWIPVSEIISNLEKRSTKILLPTELILSLVKREIAKKGRKTIFIDGFPRDLDQMNFSLFFRDLIGYREDPDIFILIDVPEKVIDERIKYRRVCPRCQTSRNFKLFPTSKIEYVAKEKRFYLLCDNPKCQPIRLQSKEGDEAGIKPIKERLKKDEMLINQAYSLYGIPKILLRNSVPKDVAVDYVDDYEITPEYYYEFNEKDKKIEIKERPWLFLDSEGKQSYSLLSPPVVVSLIKQIAKELGR
ncbi:MAG: nucleoside monophosphate kinase [bacterium]|nr:nucleoside monophosphate kinase [bacterium]